MTATSVCHQQLMPRAARPGRRRCPANVVQTVDLRHAIYDKSGTTLLTVPLMGLFDTYGDYGSSDPQVAYQSATGHWFASLISWDCDNGFLNLAVSDSSDPTGSWSIWRIEYTGALPDFPAWASPTTSHHRRQSIRHRQRLMRADGLHRYERHRLGHQRSARRQLRLLRLHQPRI